MELTKLAVIIPTLNAAAYLERLIKSLWLQEQTIDEILIIDSGSQDQTRALAQKLNTKLVDINPENFDHGATRNLAASKTGAEVIIFMTQDALPFDRKTISGLLKPLQDERIVISYARQIASTAASPTEKYLRQFNYPPSSLIVSKDSIPTMGIRAFQNSNVCSAYKHREFNELGGFPQPAVCNEDMIFAAKAIFAGYKVSYTAQAKVWHTHNLKANSLFKRYFDIAASLDLEPQIRQLGKIESSGLDYLINQIKYLRNEKQLKTLPRVVIETAAKYLGFKCGLKHKLIPRGFKRYFGMNEKYWSKAV